MPLNARLEPLTLSLHWAGASLRRVTAAAQKKPMKEDTVQAHFVGSWTDGVYRGGVNAEGKPHGFGIKTYTQGGGPFKYERGDTYKGEWKDGLYDGKGELASVHGVVRAAGIWKRGKFSCVDWKIPIQSVDWPCC